MAIAHSVYKSEKHHGLNAAPGSFGTKWRENCCSLIEIGCRLWLAGGAKAWAGDGED
ncbi:hypothetical protein [Legionella septentrionalis]|uniref:hypothetical protein n=1 Tax=Legionella septentrionalis TaxID=2498109 RepID=UPI001315992C|nr:hypothetical protein [Legionella septentrionalis]